MYQRLLLIKSHKTIVINLGPLTYTNNEGKNTIFGVVSSDGCLRYPDGTPCPSTLGPTSYARVSYPDILKWIKEGMKSLNG